MFRKSSTKTKFGEVIFIYTCIIAILILGLVWLYYSCLYYFSTNQLTQNSQVTSGGVTIVKVGGQPLPDKPQVSTGGYTRRAKLGDSRSTGR